MSWPVFVGCSHGTDSVAGQAAIRSILAGVAAARPELDVREAFVDVQLPEVADVVAEALAGFGGSAGVGENAGLGESTGVGENAGVPDGGGDRDGSHEGAGGSVGAVVVPLLLSTGFHVRVDIGAAVEGRPARAAAPLGPDDRLVAILADRLSEVGLGPRDAVVLAAAGSTDPDAARDVRAVAGALSEALGRPVAVGYGAGALPRVAVAVARAREGLEPGGRVVVAAYLLAPGYFYDRVLESGADVVTAPLAPDARLAELALSRFEAQAEA